MPYFPVFLDLTDKSCLVVGAGDVGRRKICRLLDCGAGEVLIVDPQPPRDLMQELRSQARIGFACRPFEPDDLHGKFLVIASTGDQATNTLISRLCEEQRILCNIVDQPDKCSFIVPALVNRGELNIAVSTSGASPALAGHIKTELAERYGPEYTAWVALLKRLRPLILELGLSQSENKDIFQSLSDRENLETITNGTNSALQQALRERLPAALHQRLGALLDDLVPDA